MRTTRPVKGLLDAEIAILLFLADGCDCAEDASACMVPMVKHLSKTLASSEISTSLTLLEKTKLVEIKQSKKGNPSVLLTPNGFYNAIIRRG